MLKKALLLSFALMSPAAMAYDGYLNFNGCLGAVWDGNPTDMVCPDETMGGAYIKGIVSGSAATTGAVGEYGDTLQTTATTYAAQNTWYEVTSRTLAPGDWLCEGSSYFEAGSLLTSLGNYQFALTTTAAGSYSPSSSDEIRDILRVASAVNIGDYSRLQTPIKAFNVSSNTTVRLLTKMSALTIGGSKYAGGIRCWRKR